MRHEEEVGPMSLIIANLVVRDDGREKMKKKHEIDMKRYGKRKVMDLPKTARTKREEYK